MSDEAIWYVMQGDQQIGPYSDSQLAEYAGNGSITPETMVWAEGMENWVPAAQIENLFQAAASPVAASPATEAASYPTPGVKAANFGMWAWFLLGGIVLIIIGLVSTGMIAEANQGPEQGGEGMILAMLGLMGVGYLLTVISGIVFYIYLHRAWQCLQPGGHARTTPGKAIGFLFIPFFNLYWQFQAIHGLAVDWNRTIASYPDLRPVHPLPEGLLLGFCIVTLVFAPINLILIFMVMSQITTGINSFVLLPKHHAPGTVGFKLG